MATLIEFHVWLHDKARKWKEPEVHRNGKPVPGKRLVIEPESDNITQMKLQIARAITPYRRSGKLQYYYVVAVAETEDGNLAYRTIVPKTIVDGSRPKQSRVGYGDYD